VLPDEVTVAEGDQGVEVVVTNTYPVGSFPVSKVVDGPGASAVTPGTTFEVEVACAYPAGFPASGPVPGFDPLEVTLTAGQSQDVGPLPVGATCAVRETDDGGAASSRVAPDQVTVSDGTQNVTVVVTNTFELPPTKPPTTPPGPLAVTGAGGLGPVAFGAALLLTTGGALLLVARRREAGLRRR
jgi:hypothetical protein